MPCYLCCEKHGVSDVSAEYWSLWAHKPGSGELHWVLVFRKVEDSILECASSTVHLGHPSNTTPMSTVCKTASFLLLVHCCKLDVLSQEDLKWASRNLMAPSGVRKPGTCRFSSLPPLWPRPLSLFSHCSSACLGPFEACLVLLPKWLLHSYRESPGCLSICGKCSMTSPKSSYGYCNQCCSSFQN